MSENIRKALERNLSRLWSDPQVRELGFEKRELAEGLEWLAKTPEWDETETIRHLDEAPTPKWNWPTCCRTGGFKPHTGRRFESARLPA